MWITIGLLLLGGLYYFISPSIHNKTQTPQVCNKDMCFTVELAVTPEERQQGLMNREFLSEKEWMVFVFEMSDFHNFWMKNTLIPLDMIWIDDNYKIVRILTAQPCIADPCEVYKPGILAKYVVEINAWIAEKYGIIEWDRVKFKNIR